MLINFIRKSLLFRLAFTFVKIKLTSDNNKSFRRPCRSVIGLQEGHLILQPLTVQRCKTWRGLCINSTPNAKGGRKKLKPGIRHQNTQLRID